MPIHALRLSAFLSVLLLGSASVSAEPPSFTFRDVTAELGLAAHLETSPGKRPWRYGHGAAWGDVNNDGRPDLFAGAFAARPYFQGADAPIPNALFLNRAGKFEAVENAELQAASTQARCAGALFADLDNDDDLDLVITNHVQKVGQGTSRIFENKGEGQFRDATPALAAFTAPLGLRNAAALDVNRDGLLDLVLVDGTYGKEAVAHARLILLENRGQLQFADVSVASGLPPDKTSGLGLAVGDVNNDGWLDLFVAGCNRLFAATAEGKFREYDGTAFQIPTLDVSEGNHCGASFGDFNGDGWLDLVTTEHGVPTRLHVFQNLGVQADAAQGLPEFKEVSEACGLGTALPRGTKLRPIKTAHVAAADMNNDGRADIVTTLLMQSPGQPPQPVVLANDAERGGTWKFASVPVDRLTGYFAPGPVADFNRDGRLDLFLPSWFEDLPNYLFQNETAGPPGATVRVTSTRQGFNRQGIGAVVRAYAAGHVGEGEHLIARADITIGNGYASGEEALAHLGLGSHKSCDVRVQWQGETVDRAGIKPGEFVAIEFLAAAAPLPGQEQPAAKSEKTAKQNAAPNAATFPPQLPKGGEFVSFSNATLLQRPVGFPENMAIAKTAPRVEFAYYPGQTYAGKPWSNWGDASFGQGLYYSAIGDHLAPRGNAFVYAYDAEKHAFQLVTDVQRLLSLPEGHYTPGKIHTHVELGSDGWLYFATHRGSTKATTAANHFQGEWILRGNPTTGKSEVVAHAPVPGHCIPNGLIDPVRLIFYGGTAPGEGPANEGIQFFAYDLQKRKLLYAGANGPARAMMLSSSTGNVYYTPGGGDRPLMRYNAASGQPPEEIPGEIGLRAATEETSAGQIFTVSQGNHENPSTLFAFDVKSEKVEALGPAAVGVNQYVAALKADPTGRYLYYVPGAHGGADADGSPVVQFDVRSRTRKVLAFLHPALQRESGCVPKGTYGLALDDRGERLFITWNVSRGDKNWETCGLTVLHIPAAERATEP